MRRWCGCAAVVLGWVVVAARGGAEEVLVCGDSLMQAVSRSVVRQFASTPSVKVTTVVSIGTGLARPDVFDWPAKLREAAAGRPSAAVLLLGANDGQNLRTDAGQVVVNGTTEWEREYAARVAAVLRTLQSAGVGYILWVGLPDMRDPKLQQDCQRINRIIRTECGRVAVSEFFDVVPLFSPKPGTFSPYLIRPGGKVVQVRASDGIHFNADGADILAQAIREKIAAKLRK
ncbi:MAG: DUF459 domain-containing protein [Kiritimatiellae bacterium]|nr:DUF459 domain-containing protein [Kiritimatiellia bacterium]